MGDPREGGLRLRQGAQALTAVARAGTARTWRVKVRWKLLALGLPASIYAAGTAAGRLLTGSAAIRDRPARPQSLDRRHPRSMPWRRGTIPTATGCSGSESGLRAPGTICELMTPSRRLSSTMTRGTLPSWRNARSCSSAHTRDDDFEAIRRTDFRLHPERQHEQPHALVLAALAVAHHRTLAVVHLRICARRHHDHDSRFQRRGCAQPGHEALHAGVLALESVSSTRSCQIAIALRPRAAASSITSRYGSHALVHGARPGAAKVAAESVDPPPLVAGLASLESVDTPGRWPVLAARPAAGSGLFSGHSCGNLDGNYRHKYLVYNSFTELRTRT